MRRESALQVAVVATLVGVMLLLLGGGVGAGERPRPTSNTWRPATPEERRQYERDRLAEALIEQARLNDILDRQACRQLCRP